MDSRRARRLPSGPLSVVWRVPGPARDVVVKIGPPDALGHEARTLTEVAWLGISPRLVTAAEDVLVIEALPGRTLTGRPPGLGRARMLGALLRRLHDSRATSWGTLAPGSPRVGSLAAYAHGRAAEAGAMAGARHAALAAACVARLGPPDAPDPEAAPFRRLHGDLWSANVLWNGDDVMLVDWEYARQGDPAEDIAYMAEMDDLPDRVVAAVIAGYGDPRMVSRVEALRPLVALSAGLWYEEQGLPGRGAALIAQARTRLR